MAMDVRQVDKKVRYVTGANTDFPNALYICYIGMDAPGFQGYRE